jgi:hypothetical protein
MTHVESLTRHIERQQREIASLLAKLDGTSTAASGDSSWNAREVLLHLLGATQRSVDDLRQALGDAPASSQRQAGGGYVDMPELTSEADVASALLRALDDVRDSMRDLDDETLGRHVTVTIADAGPVQVPIGLVLRNGLTAHFDEHVAQLREALD